MLHKHTVQCGALTSAGDIFPVALWNVLCCSVGNGGVWSFRKEDAVTGLAWVGMQMPS